MDTLIMPTTPEIWEALETVVDPEIPVVSLVEMGIIRSVQIVGQAVNIAITPTFSGCPALHVMQADIRKKIKSLGVPEVTVTVVWSPPWSTDRILESGRQKLKAFGLAPPKLHGGNVSLVLFDPVACPYCDSENTALRNAWGSTPCRMIHYCNQCSQPFEQFKPL